MGFISTGDRYNHRSDKALKELKGITKIVDDVLIASRTYPQHVQQIQELLKSCKPRAQVVYGILAHLQSRLPSTPCRCDNIQHFHIIIIIIICLVIIMTLLEN